MAEELQPRREKGQGRSSPWLLKTAKGDLAFRDPGFKDGGLEVAA